MNCQQFDLLLDAHGIDSLSGAARSELHGHLAMCRRCADAWLAYEALRSEVPQPPRAGLVDKVLAEATRRNARPEGPVEPASWQRRMLPAIGLAAAAAVIVVVAGLLLTDDAIERSGSGLADSLTDPVPAGITTVAAGDTPTAAGNTPRFESGIPGLIAGIHYASLPVPAPASAPAGNIEVCEFFMFGCIHCFEFETEFVAWTEAQRDNVDVIRVPAIFNATARLHAQAFYAAEALGELDALIDPFYREIHVQGNPLASKADLRAFFGRNGIAVERFDAVFDSFGVATRLSQAEDLNRRYRVNATPSIGVNGKYLTNASMAGSNEAMLEVVDALVAAEADVETEADDASCEGIDRSRCPIGDNAARGAVPVPLLFE